MTIDNPGNVCMNIDRLIRELQEIRAERGNLPVVHLGDEEPLSPIIGAHIIELSEKATGDSQTAVALATIVLVDGD